MDQSELWNLNKKELASPDNMILPPLIVLLSHPYIYHLTLNLFYSLQEADIFKNVIILRYIHFHIL